MPFGTKSSRKLKMARTIAARLKALADQDEIIECDLKTETMNFSKCVRRHNVLQKQHGLEITIWKRIRGEKIDCLLLTEREIEIITDRICRCKLQPSLPHSIIHLSHCRRLWRVTKNQPNISAFAQRNETNSHQPFIATEAAIVAHQVALLNASIARTIREL